MSRHGLAQIEDEVRLFVGSAGDCLRLAPYVARVAFGASTALAVGYQVARVVLAWQTSLARPHADFG